jgi:hypothetical protein
MITEKSRAKRGLAGIERFTETRLSCRRIILAPPPPSPTHPPSVSSTATQHSGRETTCWRKGVGSQIIRRRGSLVLYKSFNTLWDILSDASTTHRHGYLGYLCGNNEQRRNLPYSLCHVCPFYLFFENCSLFIYSTHFHSLLHLGISHFLKTACGYQKWEKCWLLL